MTKRKHTPGPWVVDLDQSFTLGGDVVSVEAVTPDGREVVREVCSLMLDTDDHPDGPEWLEDAANARLVSAAPDLLTACDRALSLIADVEQQMEGLHRMHLRNVAETLRKAIAKAEGKP